MEQSYLSTSVTSSFKVGKRLMLDIHLEIIQRHLSCNNKTVVWSRFFSEAKRSFPTDDLGRETTALCVLSVQCKFVLRYVLQLSVFLFRVHVIKGVSLLCVSFQNTTGIQNESGE